MTLHPLDHVFALLVALVFPVVDFFWIRARARRIRAGETELRPRLYRKILREEWLASFALLAIWFGLGRSAADLGLVPTFGPLAWAGYGLAAMVCGLLVRQQRALREQPEQLARVRRALGGLLFLMPGDDRELRSFNRVSLTAGFCEEIVFRGFLVAYVMALFGAPFWVAGVVTSVVFGLAHSYQGPLGILKTGMVGGALVVLYGMTGSLWASMLVHAVMDLTSGRIALAARSGGDPGSASELAA